MEKNHGWVCILPDEILDIFQLKYGYLVMLKPGEVQYEANWHVLTLGINVLKFISTAKKETLACSGARFLVI
jgi:hypothetical protein